MRILVIIMLLAVTMLPSCDCYQMVSGKVIDASTNTSIEGVTLTVWKNSWNNHVTDSSGTFRISSISGGLKCPPISLIVQKKGYQTLNLELKSNQGYVIKMQKE